MSEEPELPQPLAEVVADFDFVDRALRAELLIECADRFEEVPPAVATRPFPESARAPRCESEAFVFAVDRADGTLDLYFAVENPQGISAKAWAVILRETLSGQPLERVAAVPGDVLYRIFGRDLSMGKGQGLLGMLELVQHEARRRLEARRRHAQGIA
ncbi:MAG TPA: SufE family protein [Candidatus Acidoferrales bacterium]|nr:SufE family protein [Candidatus Acidoferrales bacterium]